MRWALMKQDGRGMVVCGALAVWFSALGMFGRSLPAGAALAEADASLSAQRITASAAPSAIELVLRSQARWEKRGDAWVYVDPETLRAKAAMDRVTPMMAQAELLEPSAPVVSAVGEQVAAGDEAEPRRWQLRNGRWVFAAIDEEQRTAGDDVQGASEGLMTPGGGNRRSGNDVLAVTGTIAVHQHAVQRGIAEAPEEPARRDGKPIVSGRWHSVDNDWVWQEQWAQDVAVEPLAPSRGEARWVKRDGEWIFARAL